MYRRAFLLLSVAVTTIATSCGELYTVVRRYQLSPRPGVSLSLPAVAEDSGNTATRQRPSREAYPCAGFVSYKLSPRRGLDTYEVRLTSTDPPILEVAFGYLDARKPDLDRERELGQAADTIARLVLNGSGVETLFPPVEVVRLKNDERERWCMRS